MCDISADGCGYQILGTKIVSKEGRISYILTNLTPNISALNSKRFSYWLLKNEPLSGNYTILNKQSKTFFSGLESSCNIGKH